MYIGVDLGSTNMKVALYDTNFKAVSQYSCPVNYIRDNGFVEFDILQYFDGFLALLRDLRKDNPNVKINQIAFTGQAESLVCLDKHGNPLYNAISWMDERSTKECEYIASKFSTTEIRDITGQQAVLPTWPATKILWLKNNMPQTFKNVATYMLLKDYIIYRLTGIIAADMSIATFSFYFDIYKKKYWKEMLDLIGISEKQLPKLIEPCTVIGNVSKDIAEKIGFESDVKVNVGTLDHFAGMIGTGNTKPGIMTLSTGTTMVLSSMTEQTKFSDCKTSMHYGFIPNTYVMLPVMESGGNCLDWFRRTCMNNIGYKELDDGFLNCGELENLIFLPYLFGTNAPEFDSEATGVFYGLRQEHNYFHMAKAVVEGVCFVLRKNCEDVISKGTNISYIVATGGGAKSAVWCQAQADITGIPVVVPEETEAAALGAAIIAAVGDGKFDSITAANIMKEKKRYTPRSLTNIDLKYKKFCKLYNACLDIANEK